jgi:hypothetical protein
LSAAAFMAIFGFAPSALHAQPPLTITANPTNNAPAQPTTTEKGSLFAEILRSKGTNGSYTLTKSNILPDTLSVYAGGRPLILNRDYWFDAGTSTLFIPAVVSRYDSISVDYRYLEGAPINTKSILPGLRLNFGANTQLGLTFGTATNNGLGMNISTYGLSLASKFGSAKNSNFRSLMYFSNTVASDNTVMNFNVTNTAQNQDTEGAGALFLQDLNLQSGNVKFKAGFQEVGEKFNGFKTLRANYANDKAMLDELTQLEGERGIKRSNFGVGFATGGRKNPGYGLQFDMNRLQDGNDAISTQSVKYTGANFSAGFNSRDIGKNFTRFAGLREADKGTWQQQAGVKANAFQVDYRFGMGGGKKPTFGGLGFSSMQFSDTTGSLRSSNFNYNAGNLGFNLTSRNSDTAFARIKDLSVAEKNSLILDVFRQYDTNAKAESISDADRAQLANEAGLDRNALQTSLGLGNQAGIQLGQLSLKDNAQVDGSSTFRRDNLALKTKSFQVTTLHQKAAANFSRLGNLSDTERGFLALDILRGYNLAGTLAMVTPNDRALMGRGAGLERSLFRLDIPTLKGTGFSLSQINVKDIPAQTTGESAGFQRTAINLITKKFDVSLLQRNTDRTFTRAGDLTDIEKTYLALDIRKTYDPSATPEQITPKEREQAAREVGVARTDLQTTLQLGTKTQPSAFTLHQSSVTSALGSSKGDVSSAKVRRDSWRYNRKNLQVSFLDQAIDSNFLRLSELSDIERAYLGNERGLQRQSLLINWLFNKKTNITFQHQSIGNTEESLKTALGQAPDQDPTEVARKVKMGLQRTGLQVETKGLNLGLNWADTSKNFSRSSDLAIPDPEKSAIEMARGFRSFGYALKGSPIKGLLLDLNNNNANNSEEMIQRGIFKNEATFNPNKKLAVSFRSVGDMISSPSGRNGQATQFLTLNQQLGKGSLFNWTQDANDVYANGQATQGMKVNQYSFTTAENRPNTLKIVRRELDFFDGKLENSTLINVKAKPTKAFNVGYTRQDVEKGEQGTEAFDALDFQWQATKKFSLLAGLSQRDVKDPSKPDDQGQGDIKTYTIGIQGEPTKDLTLTAKFDEVHNVSQNVKDVADISLSNAKPIKLGPLQDFVITARYASLNDQKRMMNETMTGRVSGKLWKNEFVLDYGGNIDKTGNTIARTYFFSTDPNPKRWFKGSFYYKVRTLLDGREFTIRRFTADARLSKRTAFSYVFGMLQEDERLQILPVNSMDIALKHNFRKGVDFQFFYRLSDNAATKIMTRSLGFGFEGQLDRTNKLGVYFSADGNNWPDRFDRSNHFRLSYEMNLKSNRFLNLSADFRSHDAPGVPDEVMGTLDFRFRF